MKAFKKNHSKSVILFTLIFCLFAPIFYSCDKTKVLEGTIWNGKSSFRDSEGYYWDTDINIAFMEDYADIRLLVVNNYWDITVPCIGKSTYTCDQNNLTIKITWNNNFGIFSQYFNNNTNWIGIFDKNSMTLTDGFGKPIKFTKR